MRESPSAPKLSWLGYSSVSTLPFRSSGQRQETACQLWALMPSDSVAPGDQVDKSLVRFDWSRDLAPLQAKRAARPPAAASLFDGRTGGNVRARDWPDRPPS